MKRYLFSCFIFVFAVLTFFVTGIHQTYGAGSGQNCKPNFSKGNCNGKNLYCINNACKFVLVGSSCKNNNECYPAGLVCDLSTSICRKPVGSGGKCTGTGQGNCASGYSCKVPNIPACTPVITDQKLCQSICQKNPVSDLGKSCKKNSDCSGKEVCKVRNPDECAKIGGKDPSACDKICQNPPPPPPTPTDTPPPTNCFSDAQCPPDNLCTGYDPYECAHLGVNCTGNCTPVKATPTPTDTPTPQLPPCKQWSNGKCLSTATGVGTFATDPSQFIKTIFDILLSISGGIALLLIIRAGYQLMTSQGKPQQVQEGRDQLIAAIVGLVFLIFSFVVLQVIGFDILKIPGFGQ